MRAASLSKALGRWAALAERRARLREVGERLRGAREARLTALVYETWWGAYLRQGALRGVILHMRNRALTRAMRGPSFAYSPRCTHSTRAGIEWRHCHRAVCMARPHEEPHHSGRACA